MEETARSILSKVPDPISLADVLQKYPVMYEESMNTVLAQEVTRYNKLLTTVQDTLQVSSLWSTSIIAGDGPRGGSTECLSINGAQGALVHYDNRFLSSSLFLRLENLE